MAALSLDRNRRSLSSGLSESSVTDAGGPNCSIVYDEDPDPYKAASFSDLPNRSPAAGPPCEATCQGRFKTVTKGKEIRQECIVSTGHIDDLVCFRALVICRNPLWLPSSLAHASSESARPHNHISSAIRDESRRQYYDHSLSKRSPPTVGKLKLRNRSGHSY